LLAHHDRAAQLRTFAAMNREEDLLLMRLVGRPLYCADRIVLQSSSDRDRSYAAWAFAPIRRK